MAAYYNDNDPSCAAWLENLVAAGRVAAGRVDARSILEVSADELADFAQVHLFAGIGGWAHALDLAGWPDDEPVWTASCPCQPFSSAGQRRGADDERHLWPAVRHLVDELRPPALFGEQVASPLGRSWLAGVRADLEALGYRVGASDLPAAGVGAPHIRQRLYFAAYRLADPDRRRRNGPQAHPRRRRPEQASTVERRDDDGLADPERLSGRDRSRERRTSGRQLLPLGDRPEASATPRGRGRDGGLADPGRLGDEPDRLDVGAAPGRGGGEARQQRVRPDSRPGRPGSGLAVSERVDGRGVEASSRDGSEPRERGAGVGLGDADGERRQGRQAERRRLEEPTEVSGAWDDSEWIFCPGDGQHRRVGSGVFPLADGVPGRVVRLRAYGNAIVPPLAAEFIAAAEEARAEAMP